MITIRVPLKIWVPLTTSWGSSPHLKISNKRPVFRFYEKKEHSAVTADASVFKIPKQFHNWILNLSRLLLQRFLWNFSRISIISMKTDTWNFSKKYEISAKISTRRDFLFGLHLSANFARKHLPSVKSEYFILLPNDIVVICKVS